MAQEMIGCVVSLVDLETGRGYGAVRAGIPTEQSVRVAGSMACQAAFVLFELRAGRRPTFDEVDAATFELRRYPDFYGDPNTYELIERAQPEPKLIRMKR